MPHPLKTLTLFAFGLCLGILLTLLLYYRPFWGLIDDGNVLTTVEYVKKVGIWQSTRAQIQGDLQWGMLRPYMTAMMVALYGWDPGSPIYTYILSAAWALIAHWLFFYVILRSHVGVALRSWAGKTEIGFTSPGLLAVFFLLVSLASPWFHFYFQLPSLQEKVVILWAAGAFALLSSDWSERSNLPTFFCSALVTITLGVLTKAQFVFFGPLLLAAVWRNGSKPPLGKAAVVVALFSAGAIFIKILASKGLYTSSYSGEAILENLRVSKTIYLFVFAAIIHLIFVLWRRKEENLSLANAYSLLSPAFGLLAFVVLMLPWRVGGYLNVIAMPFLSLILGTWALKALAARKLKFPGAIFLGTLAIAITFGANARQFEALGSLRVLIKEAKAGHWPQEVKTVYNTCNEGSGHLQHYLSTFGRLSDLKVIYSDPAAGKLPDHDSYWLEHSRLCPASSADKQVILGIHDSNAFQLVRHSGN